MTDTAERNWDSTVAAAAPQFAQQLVAWQKEHGRHHLPWQNTRDPYRVWLSEIMLQQTQVSTVLDYYARFLNACPTVDALAAAHPDQVLGLWSGLGYYSRARNLHQCAKDVVNLHKGQFPSTALALQCLPGIGPSTAAAIASFCFAERAAILDGNVKRVLTRVLGFSGDLSQSRNTAHLLEMASRLLPEVDLHLMMPRYTQGLMDLGATVCTRRKPQCDRCPVKNLCSGYVEGTPEKYPVKSKKLVRSSENLSLLWARRPDGSVWLERRPVAGIWGGLYCMPVFETEKAVRCFLPKHLAACAVTVQPFIHVLTHKDLHLYPIATLFAESDEMPVRSSAATGAESDKSFSGAWLAADAWAVLGLPAPIRKLLLQEARQLELAFNVAHQARDAA